MAENVHCLIEIPKGSRNKYEWDEELQAIKLDRFLFASVVYPTDYGFIPETLGEDGDPLDAMVCVTEPTFPGCVIPVRVIALFRMRDDKGVDDKVVCIPEHDPNWRHVEKLEDLGEPLRDEISHFFSIYKQPEGIAVKVDGWFPREQAMEIIEEAKERYRNGRKDADAEESGEADDADEAEASDEADASGDGENAKDADEAHDTDEEARGTEGGGDAHDGDAR
jgi:inorganic pyrophosphatase